MLNRKKKRFFLNCTLYDDLRWVLFSECSNDIERFVKLDDDQKLVEIMNCD